MRSFDFIPGEIGKFTPEQLAKERQARAARDELFQRICDEAESTVSTFGEAASRLGISHHLIDYFQADRENARAAWEKIQGSSVQKHDILHGRIRQLKAFLKRNSRAILARSVILLAVLGVAVLLAVFFRYDIRTVDDKGFVIVRHDRWTGNIERCVVTQGCRRYSRY